MKYWMLVCSSMGQEPLEALGGRTVLEVAKTPHLQQLAKTGRVGTVHLIPRSLEPSREVACLSALGYDPLEHYTGLAPLEALALSLSSDDRELIFRCDFVTVSQGVLVDAKAGNISSRESRILLQAIQEKFRHRNYRFIEGSGYRNYLVIDDAEHVEELDEADCTAPHKALGGAIKKFLPGGRAAHLLKDLIKRSGEILEAHEINRVRVDLGENPANQLWLWGQGKQPKIPSFKQLRQLEGRVLSGVPSLQGLGIACGLGLGEEFTFIYHPELEEDAEPKDFRKKIKLLEEFDSKIVGAAVQEAERCPGSARICVISDEGQAAPYLMQGSGIEAEGAWSFDEINCTQSKREIVKGHRLMEEFLA